MRRRKKIKRRGNVKEEKEVRRKTRQESTRWTISAREGRTEEDDLEKGEV